MIPICYSSQTKELVEKLFGATDPVHERMAAQRPITNGIARVLQDYEGYVTATCEAYRAMHVRRHRDPRRICEEVVAANEQHLSLLRECIKLAAADQARSHNRWHKARLQST